MRDDGRSLAAEVEKAVPTGFCFGVRRAIQSLEHRIAECARSGGRGTVYSIGMPIHNPQEVERLRTMGLEVVDCIEDVPEGAPCFIRAHGIPPEEMRILAVRCGDITDGTCPFVQNAQTKAALLCREGYPLLVLGDPGHPEVQGIVGFSTGTVHVARTLSQVRGLGRMERLGVISQTTQRADFLGSAVRILAPKVGELRVFNTICGATSRRQEAVRALSKRVDGIIVIGGRNSANTAKLMEIARSGQKDVLWIEHAGELDGRWCAGKARIGLAAGASTPDWLVEDVKRTIEKTKGARGMEGYDGRDGA